MEKQKSFKIASLNAHGWRDKSNHYSFLQFLDLLKPLDIDILALEEVYHPDHYKIENKKEPVVVLQHLAEQLDCNYFFFSANHKKFGNAILVKKKFQSQKIAFQKLKVKNFQKRSFGIVSIKLENENFNFCVLHLDHISEQTRLEQVKIMNNFLTENKIVPHFLIGDFNSLSSKSDYSKKKNLQIFETRLKNSWESPVYDIYQEITSNLNYIDSWKAIHPNQLDAFSCWIGTRIDYIFIQNSLINSKFTLDSFDMIENDATDHSLLLLQISLIEEKK
ncbi:hypothetical protein M0811_06114 [Anaeramoeba ignava]|uniref:Endonuclease/exonuclease/phosphatase domain-containing protein n=1 Tax=Anaeramoeba ignava TaxID=1746090 RepID=A0A9Q0LQ65_ANAIG|nr:hypothetical protein M0811_06114 [Anaeramoeba ignava]